MTLSSGDDGTMSDVEQVLPQVEVSIVRVKLGPDRPAPQPDPLGRDRVGFVAGLPTHDLWERGRGVWKAKLTTVAEADLLVVVAEGTVQLVGSIDGVDFHADRVAIDGRPLPKHPLVGRPDPIPNRSQNPIAYGRITTAPAAAFPVSAGQRPYEQLLTEAIGVLTEAVRLRRPTLQQTESGLWAEHPTRTEQNDWAEFVSLALAGAAANTGGIEAALAGRSGSWEAGYVRDLLLGVVGTDEAELWRHRTAPLTMTLYVDELISDVAPGVMQAYDQAGEELQGRIEAAEQADPEPVAEDYVWWYDRAADGTFVARDPAAPAWSWEAWRNQPDRPDTSPEWKERIEESLRTGIGIFSGQPNETISAYIAKSSDAAAELWRLEDERDARLQAITKLEENLETQRLAEWRSYGDALKVKIEQLGSETPGLEVPINITIDVTTFRPSPDTSDWDSIEGRLLSAALEQVPTPMDLPGTPLERLQGSTEDTP